MENETQLKFNLQMFADGDEGTAEPEGAMEGESQEKKALTFDEMLS